VQGQPDQVKSFLQDIRQRPQIELHQEGMQEMADVNRVCVTFEIDLQPSRRVKIVHLETKGGGEIRMPLLDLVYAEIEEGRKILAGKSFDIFADRKKEPEKWLKQNNHYTDGGWREPRGRGSQVKKDKIIYWWDESERGLIVACPSIDRRKRIKNPRKIERFLQVHQVTLEECKGVRWDFDYLALFTKFWW
jgi:hypothetical protein